MSMSKIIGVTVGTPTSPAKIEEELKIFVAQNSDTVTWDGNAEGRTTVDFTDFFGSHCQLVHVSDAVLTLADIPDEGISGTVFLLSDVYDWHATKEKILSIHPGVVEHCYGEFVSVSEEAVGTEWPCPIGGNKYAAVTFPKAGLYFNITLPNGEGLRSITIPGYTGFVARKIDPALLPDASNSIHLIDQTTGAKYKVYVSNGKLTMESEV